MIQGHTRRDGLLIDALGHVRTMHHSKLRWIVTCEYNGDQDRSLHHLHMVPMAAAARNGCDVQDRTRSQMRKTLPAATTLAIF